MSVIISFVFFGHPYGKLSAMVKFMKSRTIFLCRQVKESEAGGGLRCLGLFIHRNVETIGTALMIKMPLSLEWLRQPIFQSLGYPSIVPGAWKN